MISDIQLSANSVFPSAQFQSNVSLSDSFERLKNRFDLNDEFISDLKVAFNPDRSLASQNEPAGFLEVDSMMDDLVSFAAKQPGFNQSRTSVTGGTVTLSTESGSRSITIQPRDRTEIIQNNENTLVVFNRTSNEALRVKADESLTVEGNGQLSIPANGDGALRLSGGETAEVARDEGQLLLKENNLRTELSITDSGRTLSVGENAESLTLFTGPDSSITVESGQTARLERTGDDRLKITNESTGETLTVKAGQELSTTGADSVSLGETNFELAGGDTLQVSKADDGALTLTNTSVAKSTELSPTFSTSNNASDFELGAISNPVAAQTRILGSLLPVTAGDTSAENDQLPVKLNEVVEPLSDRPLDELPGATTLSSDVDDSGPLTAERGISETLEQAEQFIDADINMSVDALREQGESAFAIEDQDGETLFSIREKRDAGLFESTNDSQFIDINDTHTFEAFDETEDEFIDIEQ